MYGNLTKPKTVPKDQDLNLKITIDSTVPVLGVYNMFFPTHLSGCLNVVDKVCGNITNIVAVTDSTTGPRGPVRSRPVRTSPWSLSKYGVRLEMFPKLSVLCT